MDDTLWNHIEAAQTRRPDLGSDAPSQQPMRAGIKPAQQKAPTGDQKKVRRQRARTSSTPSSVSDHQESTMTAPTEADLLRAMASATTTPDLMAAERALTAFRDARRDQIQSEASLDWDGMGHQDLAPVFASTPEPPAVMGRTASSLDWLDYLEDDVSHDDGQVTASMRAEATEWYENVVWEPVKHDVSEFTIQAANAARRHATPYGLRSQAAASSFLETVDHLYRKEGFLTEAKTAADAGPVKVPTEWGTDEWDSATPQPVQAPPFSQENGSKLPFAGDNPQTFDGLQTPLDGESSDPKSDVVKTPSVQEGSTPQGDQPKTNTPPVMDTQRGTYDDSTRNPTFVDPVPSGGTGKKAGSFFADLRAVFADDSVGGSAQESSAPSLQEGSTPEGDHPAAATQENPTGDLDMSTWGGDPDTLSTGGQDGTDAATGNGSQQWPTPGSSGRSTTSALTMLAGTPAWLQERVSDPYGTPNKDYDKASGQYVDSKFWTAHPPKTVGNYKIIQVDGMWYGYDTRNNMWTTGMPDEKSVTDMANKPHMDMNASKSVQAGEGMRMPMKCSNGHTWVKKAMYGGSNCPKCGQRGEAYKKTSSANTDSADYKSGYSAGRADHAKGSGFSLGDKQEIDTWANASQDWKDGWSDGWEAAADGKTAASMPAGGAKWKPGDPLVCNNTDCDTPQSKGKPGDACPTCGEGRLIWGSPAKKSSSLQGLGHAIANRAQTANVITFGQALSTMSSLDDRIEDFSGHDIVRMVLASGDITPEVRTSLQQVVSGDVPEAFKKQWDKGSGGSDSGSNSGGSGSGSSSSSNSGQWMKTGDVPSGTKSSPMHNGETKEGYVWVDGSSDSNSNSSSKGNSGGSSSGKPDWLKDKMDKNSTASTRPCDICMHEGNMDADSAKQAKYDGKTIYGPWANMCEGHFKTHGMGLGTGRGQKLAAADGDGQHGYVVFYKSDRKEVHADSTYQAQQKAISQFWPKAKGGDVTVVLAERPDGSQVTHAPMM